MTDKDEFMKKAFHSLDKDDLPELHQKERIFLRVKNNQTGKNDMTFSKIGKYITVCPWRFAFMVSAMQTILCTAFLGAKYTNFVLSIFGR